MEMIPTRMLVEGASRSVQQWGTDIDLLFHSQLGSELKIPTGTIHVSITRRLFTGFPPSKYYSPLECLGQTRALHNHLQKMLLSVAISSSGPLTLDPAEQAN